MPTPIEEAVESALDEMIAHLTTLHAMKRDIKEDKYSTGYCAASQVLAAHIQKALNNSIKEDVQKAIKIYDLTRKRGKL